MVQPKIKPEYIIPRFGVLFTGAAQLFEINLVDLCAVIGEAVGRKGSYVQSDFPQYKKGNLLGKKLRYTPNSNPSTLEADIGRLLEVMYAMSIPQESESEMLKIIREETKLGINYPPTIPGERLTWPYNVLE